MEIIFVCTLVALGAVGGFAAGLLGIGGGVIFVPCLVALFTFKGLPSAEVTHMAIATTMATIFLTALSSVRTHQKHKAIYWHVVFSLTPGIFLGTLLGGKIFIWLSTGELTLLFALFISYSAWQMLSQGRKAPAAGPLPGKFALASAGSVIGFMSSLVGVGGGFAAVPFLTRCSIPIRNAIATSAALGIPVTFFSTANNIANSYHLANLPSGSFGYIYLPALLCIASASVLTAPFGARLTHQLHVKQLRRLFAYILFALSIYMFSKGLWILYTTP